MYSPKQMLAFKVCRQVVWGLEDIEDDELYTLSTEFVDFLRFILVRVLNET